MSGRENTGKMLPRRCAAPPKSRFHLLRHGAPQSPPACCDLRPLPPTPETAPRTAGSGSAGMASGGSAGRDAYDEEAGGRRPLELDGRDAAAAAASSSDHRPGELEFVSSSPGGVAVWLRRIWCGVAVLGCRIGRISACRRISCGVTGDRAELRGWRPCSAEVACSDFELLELCAMHCLESWAAAIW